MRWVLVKKSEGTRGVYGKSKMYEIDLAGTVVRTAWGKAEEPLRESFRQCGSEEEARMYADEKLTEKKNKGYKILVAI